MDARPVGTDDAPPDDATTRGARRVVLDVNGTACEVAVHPLRPLAGVLRDELGLTGTKLGCQAGDCGSCTVLLDDVPVVSCLVPVARAEGARVVTIEGLPATAALHPVQEAFMRANASQCGFCIPGIIMGAVELVAQEGPLSRDDVAVALAGNLCRCTGYETIVDAIVDAHQRREAGRG
jgi:carbon-monoxide dehydrogenase small subunit